jgi:drug/metabolite transporter superfamily protein YnfA
MLLFVAAAVFEIGGAWLVWQGIRDHRGWWWIGSGVAALGVYRRRRPRTVVAARMDPIAGAHAPRP